MSQVWWEASPEWDELFLCSELKMDVIIEDVSAASIVVFHGNNNEG